MTRSLEASVVLCPVCGKKVGVWRKPPVHPKCLDRFEHVTPTSLREAFGLPPLEQAIGRMTQAQRDRILRRMPTKVTK